MKYRITLQTEDPLTIEEFLYKDKEIAKSVARLLSNMKNKSSVILESMYENQWGSLEMTRIDFEIELEK